MNKRKYYYLFDLQTGGYLHTGRNSSNKKELKDFLLSYISIDFDEEEGLGYDDYNKMSVEEVADMFDFRIDTTNEPIEE